jgi:hypothetical protein
MIYLDRRLLGGGKARRRGRRRGEGMLMLWGRRVLNPPFAPENFANTRFWMKREREGIHGRGCITDGGIGTIRPREKGRRQYRVAQATATSTSTV